MIIECPACTTRYDIKAELPPEGRSVRCAKCGTVWRAMPETHVEVEEAREEGWEPRRAEQETCDRRAAEEESERQHLYTPGHAYAREWPREDDGVAVEQTHAEHDESAYAESGEEFEPAASPEQREEETGSGKVSWFNSFRRKRKSRTDAEEVVVAGPELASADPIPFPRAAFPEAPPAAPAEEELRTLEEARQAVRSVFSSLGNGRSAVGARALSPAVAATAAEEEGDERRAAESQVDEGDIHAAVSHVAELPAYLNWTSDAANPKQMGLRRKQPARGRRRGEGALLWLGSGR